VTAIVPSGSAEVVRQRSPIAARGKQVVLGVGPAKRTKRMAAGSTIREAIRQATPPPSGKHPGWLAAAVAKAERTVTAPAVEAAEEPRGRVNVE
jgi:hypothetical protein